MHAHAPDACKTGCYSSAERDHPRSISLFPRPSLINLLFKGVPAFEALNQRTKLLLVTLENLKN